MNCKTIRDIDVIDSFLDYQNLRFKIIAAANLYCMIRFIETLMLM